MEKLNISSTKLGTLKNQEFSRSYPSDPRPRYQRHDEKQRELIKARVRIEKEQRQQDGKYCILERALTDEEKRGKEAARHSDFDSKEDSRSSESETRNHSGLDSKSDINEGTTETESMVDPEVAMVGSICENNNSSDDEDEAEEGYWGDTSSDEEEDGKQENEKQQQQPEIEVRDEFAVGVGGAFFGSSVKDVAQGFALPSPAAPEHFKILFEDGAFGCHAIDCDSVVTVTRKRHQIRPGDCLEFGENFQLNFREIIEDNDDSAAVSARLTMKCNGSESEILVKIPSREGLDIGVSKECGIRFPTDGTETMNVKFALLRLKDQNLVVQAHANHSFKVILCGKTESKERRSAENLTSYSGNQMCPLSSGDVLGIPAAPSLQYTVTTCYAPREDRPCTLRASGQWCSVHNCCAIEEPNFAMVDDIKEHQDRIIVKDGFCGDLGMGLFAVFDGHDGKDVADVAAATFPFFLEEELKKLKLKGDRMGLGRPGLGSLHKKVSSMYDLMDTDSHHKNKASSTTDTPPRPRTLTRIKHRGLLRNFFNDDELKRRRSTDMDSVEMSLGPQCQDDDINPVVFFEAEDIISGPALALKRACVRVADVMTGLLSDKGKYQGSTGQICLVRKDMHTGIKMLHSASVGDSGAILIRKGRPVEVSTICRHKPDHKLEVARIERKKGNVRGGRFMGMLSVTRAFGDLCMSSYGLISEPHFSETEIGEEDSHLVIASDGVWDYISSTKVAELVLNSRSASDACQIIINTITTASPKKVSRDNIAVIVVELTAKEPSSSPMEQQQCNMVARCSNNVLMSISESTTPSVVSIRSESTTPSTPQALRSSTL
mmetsp:Transcript_11737/g.18816  ORF Transcript_11737/g.18816 Transcript_11737/m.18816 type:complete len:832 (-) Transcript_11737:465-2960(-)